MRISKYKSTFTKRYEANFTEELFKIARMIHGDPDVYDLEDHEGEPIIGKFCEEELSAIDKKDDDALLKLTCSYTPCVQHTFFVSKSTHLKRKKLKGKTMALVKWQCYDSKHNSWIPESSIQNMA